MQEDAGLNFYDYVMNNPVNYIDPLGLYPDWRKGGRELYYQTHPRPTYPGLNINAGFAGYDGFGGEISFSTCECCDKGKKYRVVVLTACGGVGGGGSGKAKLELPHKTGGGISQADSSCPPDHTWYVKSEANIGPFDYMQAWGDASGKVSATPTYGASVSLAVCRDTVISKYPVQ